ncbi:MAG: protein kinase [Deltaproteobacteria bacterium]|nr:protein kinase [Deltaproteobacteria bacterium]
MSTRGDVPGAGDVIAEKYRVERVLGEGGMGTVLEATHLFTGKNVAIKWMLPALSSEPEAAARFLREAQIAGKLDHPNIVDVHDVGRERGSMYLVMERLHGETLAELLDRGKLAPADAVRLVMPVFRAIAAAHDAGVVHRDLKPENVFLCRDNTGRALEPKVLDFGISKLLDAPESMKLTRTGMVVGTMFYMAPEQIAGAQIGPTADVFSLGVIVYQCIVGAMPYDARNFNALVVEMATKDAISMRDRDASIDPLLDAAVLRALHRDATARYPDVASFAHALEPFAPGVRFELPRETWRNAKARATTVTPRAPTQATSEIVVGSTTRPAMRSMTSVLVWLGAIGAAAIGAAVVVWVSLFGLSSPRSSAAAPATNASRGAPSASPGDAPSASPPAQPTVSVGSPGPTVVAPTLPPALAPQPVALGPAATPAPPTAGLADPPTRTEPASPPEAAARRPRRTSERPPDVRRSAPRTRRIRVEDF